MKAPDVVPLAVEEALLRFSSQHSVPQESLFARLRQELKFDPIMGCYWFDYAGMYHGVELNGSIHT